MRRGNKSSKVPNVKLRPAQPALKSRHDPQNPAWDHSSDSEIAPNASMVDLCPRPLRGATLCATGIIDKPTLFKQAFELGATTTSDFTDRVTHLLANAHGGPKYMCALERKIPIMRPEWITESYDIWLRGDDVDLHESIEKYRLPIFSGVILSLSGIDDMDRRTEINSLVTKHGGVYAKNLERPVKVTHLLCSGDVETDKMKYAEKFNKRGEASIHLVWEEWFWDSLEFGGRFDERKYQVSRPRPERKSLHEEPSTSCPVDDSAPGSRAETAIPVNPQLPRMPPEPHTNTNQDAEEEETASIKRIPAVTLQLWESLLKPRGFGLEGGKLVRSPTKSQLGGGSPPSSPTKPPPPRKAAAPPNAKDSVISSFRRANSFACVSKEPNSRQPFRRTTTLAAVTNGPEDAEGSGLGRRTRSPSLVQMEPHQDQSGLDTNSVPALFLGYRFRLLGEARSPNVRAAIESGGGVVLEDDAEDVDFIVARLISGSKLYRDEPDEYERAKYRTECWLEHSVFLERICLPDENVSFTPLKINIPIPGAELVHLSLSGLDQSEVCWIRRLLRALGVNLAPSFSRRSTHLLCPSGTGAKFDKAKEWGIPVVSLDWLVEMAQKGVVPSVDGYIVGLHIEMGAGPDPEFPKRDKGKGKEADVQMVDITNNAPSDPPLFSKKANLLQDMPTREPSVFELNQDQDDGDGFFGKPNGSLGPPPPQRVSLSPPPPPPMSSSPPLECPAVSPNRVHPAHASLASIEDERLDPNARIPSSKSPSPMKLPPSSASMPSPARPLGPNEITRALQESITTLLGKRQVSDEDGAPHQRRGKRVRPQPRSKIQSRQASKDTMVSPVRAPPPVYDPECYDEMNILDGGTPMDESLRVTYEDPGQQEEKRRLMSLLGGKSDNVSGGGTEGSARKGKGPVRRSTRMAGF
ncbi:hypothetical protein BV22DRAFT_1083119 [Leucogyrophana mollusca]|uniref:Uncharacterized protein n=1 Tax=Leucogyrophana mollusca TaxID=85980 RepID=A0ACB8BSE1_9AGAM|nr:hypothetical protein BV22DRAFT_1083119 [Leucogyrophana mollusca]